MSEVPLYHGRYATLAAHAKLGDRPSYTGLCPEKTRCGPVTCPSSLEFVVEEADLLSRVGFRV